MLERLGRWFDGVGWRRTIIGVPYVWLAIFFLLPFLIVVAMSLATRAMTAPPFAFSDALPFVDLANYRRLFEDSLYVRAFLVSLGNAGLATLFTLLLGYPMALGLTGEGGFISQPLAIVVIGGLISSTLLTLVLVPTLYTMVENAKERLRARRRRAGGGAVATGKPGPAHAAPEPPVGTDSTGSSLAYVSGS